MNNVSGTADTEGLIKVATISAPDVDALAAIYAQYFELKVIEKGRVSAELATSWGCAGMSDAPFLVMTSTNDTPIYIRLVQNPDMPPYTPLRSFGWNAIEINVRDVDALHNSLQSSPFKVIGPPAPLAFSDAFIPMQVVGPVGEVLFLNEVRSSLPDFDLPVAQASVDHVFIMVLAAADREKAVRFYTEKMGWDEGSTYNLKYTVINNAFDLAEEATHDITMTCVGRLVNNEIDQYPEGTIERATSPNMLPPGIAMVSYMTASLDALDVEFLASPKAHTGLPYDGRRSACCIGAAGELIELIEI